MSMELSKQVVSLELAKRLKELGVEQESAWYWKHNTESPSGPIDEWVIVHYGEPYLVDSPYHIAAFTVAELGELLPSFIKAEGYGFINLRMWKMDDERHQVEYINRDESVWTHIATTEADARASMLIYLIENELIKP